MNQKQKEAEVKYRLSVSLLDELKGQKLLTVREYDSIRSSLAKKYKAPFGTLEMEDKLWKKEKQ